MLLSPLSSRNERSVRTVGDNVLPDASQKFLLTHACTAPQAAKRHRGRTLLPTDTLLISAWHRQLEPFVCISKAFQQNSPTTHASPANRPGCQNPAYLEGHDPTVGVNQFFAIKRRLSVEHLEEADTERPPIALGAVKAAPVLWGLENLWADVIWGADSGRAKHTPFTVHFQTRPEVCQDDVTVPARRYAMLYVGL